jgi:aminomethyltransferase
MSLLQEPETLKKTPLYDRHAALQGKLVNFGGWALPVYYNSIIAEHQQTRQSCSFFDVSHLGEFRVQGKEATAFLQKRLTNDVTKCQPGRIQYTLLCDEGGRTLDDILVYKQNEEDYYIIVNASNIDRDFAEFKKYAPAGLGLEDHSDKMACIAVQGPHSEAILEKLFGFHLKDMPYYSFKEEKFEGGPVWISRSGYTGEDGFEIFSVNAAAPAIWDLLASKGRALGAAPAGLGARNTLRLEAANVLYGHELDETTTPLEARLDFVVAFEKGDFVGRDALLKQKTSGVQRRLCAFKMLDKAPAREHYRVFAGGQEIGYVTSGSYAPTAGANIGMAYVTTGHESLGNVLDIEVHGRMAKAEVVKRPFVANRHKK